MAKGKFDMSEFLTPVEGVPESDTTREIAVNDILDNPLNFYPRPDNEKLAELMESIQANGMLEPPTVVPAENGKYRLISGHSRMNAVRLLASYKDDAVAERFQRVLCRVLPSMTTEQEECAVIEANRQRIKSPAVLAHHVAYVRTPMLHFHPCDKSCRKQMNIDSQNQLVLCHQSW